MSLEQKLNYIYRQLKCNCPAAFSVLYTCANIYLSRVTAYCNLAILLIIRYTVWSVAVDTKPSPQNIQDAFLNTVRREKDAVTIYLMNGAKLTGRIKSFDKFSVLLEAGAQEQLIFKHAISTISHVRRHTSGELRGAHSFDLPAGEHTGDASDRSDD